jgi:uncharacterized membrane protein
MPPLIVMLASWLLVRALGAVGVMAASSWVDALRLALGVMFLFTAASHFAPRTRPDIVRMVPPAFPRPDLLVTLTGTLELAGAVGLLLPRFTALAAWCLAVLLVAMFPANVYADTQALQIAGRRATPIAIRLPMQLFWIASLVWVARHPW